jgi:hypothetical protein
LTSCCKISAKSPPLLPRLPEGIEEAVEPRSAPALAAAAEIALELELDDFTLLDRELLDLLVAREVPEPSPLLVSVFELWTAWVEDPLLPLLEL